MPHQNDRFGQRSASCQDEISAIGCTWLGGSPPASLRLLQLPLQPCSPRNTSSQLFEMLSTSDFAGQGYAQLRQAPPSQKLRTAWRKSAARHKKGARAPSLQLQRRWRGRQRKLFESMKPELANQNAEQKTCCVSLAARVQPSLAKEPHPGQSCIDPRLIVWSNEPH